MSAAPSNAFVLGLWILAALWLSVRALAGQFNPYSPENGFANAIATLFGLCAGAAAWTARPRIIWPERLTLALLLYFGVLTWGLLRSPNAGLGVAQYGEALTYAALLGGGYVLARIAPGSATLGARAVLAVVATQAVAAAWQHFVDLPQLWESIRGGQVAVPDELAGTAGQYRLFGTDVFGSFGNSNSLAAFLLVGLGLLASFVMPARESLSHIKKAFVALLGILLLAALLWTNSKGGWVALGALLCFAFVHTRLAHRPEQPGMWVRLTFAGVLALSVLLVLGFFDVLPMPDSLRVRFEYWRAAGTLIAAQPLDGVGLGGFFDHYLQVKTALGTETRDAHNDYLHFWVELGILGPLMYVALWSVLLRGRVPEERATDARHEKIVVWSGIGGFVMMFLGFQALNAADLPALFGGDIQKRTLSSLAATLAMPLVFVLVLRCTRGLSAPNAWRGFGCAAGAVLIHQMVDFDFKAPAIMGSLFLLGGLLLGEREPADDGEKTPLKSVSLALLPAFTLVLVPLGVWFPFMSGIARKNAVVLEEELRARPESKDPAQRELKRVLLRELVLARERAAENAPFDAQVWLDLAEALRMQIREARELELRKRIIEAYQRAALLRPNAPAPRILYANFQMDTLERGQAMEFGSARLEMAAQAYAAGSQRYPLHPGIHLWEGDARLLSGDASLAAQAYLKAFAVDRQIVDANVRFSACFTDPAAGAFPRHRLDTEVLMSVLQHLQTDYPKPIQSGLQLRRVLALAGAIRSLERSSLKDEQLTTDKLRAELAARAAELPDAFETPGDRAHAAMLAAMSLELAGKAQHDAAKAWSRARALHAEAIAARSPTTPDRLFNVLSAYFGK